MPFTPFDLGSSPIEMIIPSGDTSGASDTAAIIAALRGGVAVIGAGTFYVNCGQIVADNPPQYIYGMGNWLTKIKAVGAGDLIRMYNPTAGGGAINGGGVKGVYLDGINAGSGSTGLHIGDGSLLNIDVAVANFSAGGCIGVHFDNTIWYTEQLHGIVETIDCDQHVVFDVSGAAKTSSNSFAFLDVVHYISAAANQNGIVVQNGALPYNGRLVHKGNYKSSPSAQSSAVLTVTGTVPAGHPGAGSYAQISRMHDLSLLVETDTAYSNQPSTIVYGTPGSNMITHSAGTISYGLGGTFNGQGTDGPGWWA